jgi:hypothetical protein
MTRNGKNWLISQLSTEEELPEMHNCKVTRERLAELALDEANRAGADDVTVELRECEECDREFNALLNTLRLATRGMNMAAPPESYWSGYHARLEERLQIGEAHIAKAYVPKLFSSSIMVRTPIAVAVVILFAVSLVAVAWSRRSSETITASSQPPSVVHVPVQVPVIQEKVVTRIVYKQRERRPLSRTAKQAPEIPGPDPAGLMGFKPTNEIKLTVIKGGLRDEN